MPANASLYLVSSVEANAHHAVRNAYRVLRDNTDPRAYDLLVALEKAHVEALKAQGRELAERIFGDAS